MVDIGYEIVVILLMLFVNAVFAAYEMALASISRARLFTLCQQGKRGAAEAAYMKDRMEASLAVVQLGITLAGAIAAATGGAGAQESFTPMFTWIGFSSFYAEILALACLIIPLSAFTIIFAELVPKIVALNNRERVCLMLSPMMKGIARVADPIIFFFEIIVKRVTGLVAGNTQGGTSIAPDQQGLHELNAAAALARASRLIGAHEEKIVLAAAQLSQRKVADIMLDIKYVSMIPVAASLGDALIKAHLDMHTRFPVFQEGQEGQVIIGYLNFKDIVNALKMSPENPSVRGITRLIKKLSAATPLSQALSEMMRDKAHIAMVVSPEHQEIGMITLEDIIEELVGEIEDEFDRLPTYVQACGDGWIIGGAVSMKVVTSTLGISLHGENVSERVPTLAEWVAQKLGREIQGGEVLRFDPLSITVRKLRRRKLAEALVLKIACNRQD